MKSLDASTLSEILEATLIGNSEAVFCGKVITDTRKIVNDSLFFALRGERFNADAFALQAIESGASIIVVQEWLFAAEEKNALAEAAVLIVPDTLQALQKLASWWRRELNVTVIGVTGSNGKTSTKDFLRAVLSQRYQVYATQGNLNNHIGVPLTILAIEPHHNIAICEMGMNHAGEIGILCDIAQPDYGVITNIGTAHIEFLGTRQAIAEEKGALAHSLPSHGQLWIPESCDFLDYITTITRAKVVTVDGENSSIRAENIRMTQTTTQFELSVDVLGKSEATISVVGRHMLTNALLAAAVGKRMGLDLEEIVRGLAKAELTSGRFRILKVGDLKVIDDSYNANPDSVKAALITLKESYASSQGRCWAILGKMGELGITSIQAHQDIGILAKQLGLNLVVVGDGDAPCIYDAYGLGAYYFPTHQEAAKWLQQNMMSHDVFLFKGSRTAQMEQVMHLVFPQLKTNLKH